MLIIASARNNYYSLSTFFMTVNTETVTLVFHKFITP